MQLYGRSNAWISFQIVSHDLIMHLTTSGVRAPKMFKTFKFGYLRILMEFFGPDNVFYQKPSRVPRDALGGLGWLRPFELPKNIFHDLF